MTVRYLLDTNILSDLVRHPQGQVAERIRGVGEDAAATSVVVAAELRFGAAWKGSDRLTAQVNAILGAMTVLPLEPGADHLYAEIRLAVEQAGTPVGGNDLLIAAHTLASGCVLVTANAREFSRIPGLTIENWLEA